MYDTCDRAFLYVWEGPHLVNSSSTLNPMLPPLLLLLLLSVALADPMLDSLKSLTSDNELGGKNWAVLVAGSNTYSNYRSVGTCYKREVGSGFQIGIICSPLRGLCLLGMVPYM